MDSKLFSVVAETELGAVAGKNTEQCFTGSRYAFRDGDFDRWLPAYQPKAGVCTVTTLSPKKGTTFVEWVIALFDAPTDTSVEILSKLIKKCGYVMTLTQAEEIVKAAERTPNSNMRTDGFNNFFFVENEDGNISVAFVHHNSRWSADIARLDDDHRWSDGFLLVRNLPPL